MRTALRVLGPLRGRALLPDEVGLGKTIEAGLVLKELLTHGMVKRFLVLTLPSLVDQWAEELDDKFGLAIQRGHAKWVATVTLGEFSVGGASGPALRRFFRGYVPLPLGREDAIFAGHLQARLAFELGENDLWIAGLALRHDLSLVTRDRTFSRVPGLRVLAY